MFYVCKACTLKRGVNVCLQRAAPLSSHAPYVEGQFLVELIHVHGVTRKDSRRIGEKGEILEPRPHPRTLLHLEQVFQVGNCNAIVGCSLDQGHVVKQDWDAGLKVSTECVSQAVQCADLDEIRHERHLILLLCRNLRKECHGERGLPQAGVAVQDEAVLPDVCYFQFLFGFV